MRTLTVAVMLAAGASGQARNVTVCMDKIQDVRVKYATQTASKIFAGIGVAVDWRAGGQCPSDAIQVRISHATPENADHFVLAEARPYEGIHIVVFYERVKSLVEPIDVHRLLAYVLVHEITHIVQGVKRHSAAGIMKARWDRRDDAAMLKMELGFTKYDEDLIDAGLSRGPVRRTAVALIAER
jgi:hypothetical protein